MRRKIIIAFITLAAVPLLGSYTYLSAAVGRCLNPSQFVRFSTTIALAVIHPNQGGAARAFSLFRQAMVSPTLIGSIDLDGQKFAFPLPKYAVAQEHNGDGLYFRAFVSPGEMNNYFYRDLPQAGWTHDQQLGAGHFFTGPGVRMTICSTFLLDVGHQRVSCFDRSIATQRAIEQIVGREPRERVSQEAFVN